MSGAGYAYTVINFSEGKVAAAHSTNAMLALSWFGGWESYIYLSGDITCTTWPVETVWSCHVRQYVIRQKGECVVSGVLGFGIQSDFLQFRIRTPWQLTITCPTYSKFINIKTIPFIPLTKMQAIDFGKKQKKDVSRYKSVNITREIRCSCVSFLETIFTAWWRAQRKRL